MTHPSTGPTVLDRLNHINSKLRACQRDLSEARDELNELAVVFGLVVPPDTRGGSGPYPTLPPAPSFEPHQDNDDIQPGNL
jgi:hypothetical protein